jgi:hypothetical protein
MGNGRMIDSAEFVLDLRIMLNQDAFFIADLQMTEEKNGWKKVSFLYKEKLE